jgi:hypothetical protein
MRYVLIIFSLTFARLTSGTTLVANFDSVPAGENGNLFTDGGILFTGPSWHRPPPPTPRFVIQDSTGFAWRNLTAPNFLTSQLGGFVMPGLGPLHTLGITPPAAATNVSLDLYTDHSLVGGDIGRVIVLSARLKNLPVAQVSVKTGDGFTIDNVVEHHALTLTAAFDALRIEVFRNSGGTDVTLLGIDNVRIQLVPEPATSALVMIAAILLVPLCRRVH